VRAPSRKSINLARRKPVNELVNPKISLMMPIWIACSAVRGTPESQGKSTA
jgi:hypothetical protein